MGQPNFWDNAEAAQQTIGALKGLNVTMKPLDELLRAADDLEAMIEMADEDESLAAEVPIEIQRLEPLLEELELKALLNGPHDASDAILTINARDGGLDANDWAEMLLRMYSHWAADQGYEVELLDRQDNEQAGINSATLAIRGRSAEAVIADPLSLRALPDGQACSFYGAALAEALRVLTGFEGAMVHTRCRGRGDDTCRWQAAAAEGYS